MKTSTCLFISAFLCLLLGMGIVLTTRRAPNIVVNMPEGAHAMKQLPELPVPTNKVTNVVLSGERAVLWYSVFCESMKSQWCPERAANAADRAVRICYTNGADNNNP